MKQLLFHFMFFVVSSLFFIQCAKLFPTVESPNSGRPTEGAHFKKTTLKTTGRFSSLNHIAMVNTRVKNNFVWPLFSSSIFNHNVFNYINSSKLFDEPYINFAYDKFVSDVQNNGGLEKQ